MLKKNPGCEIIPGKPCAMNNVNVIVDPMLFRKYGVVHVPAFVFAHGLNFKNPDMSEGVDSHLSAQGSSFKLEGDARLEYIISKLAEAAKSNSLEEAGRFLR